MAAAGRGERRAAAAVGAAGRRGRRRAAVAPTCGSRTVMDANINSIISAALVTMKWKVTQMTRALFMRSQALSPTTAK